MASERRCEQCGSPLDGDQRYCLTCGARAGERSPRLTALLDRVAAPPPAAASAEPEQDAAAAAQPLRLPGPRISAVLVARVRRLRRADRQRGGGQPGASRTAGAARRAEHQREHRSAAVVVLVGPGRRKRRSARIGTGGSDARARVPERGELEHPEHPRLLGRKRQPLVRQRLETDRAAAPKRKLTSIKHVFVIVLSDQPYAANFGPESGGPYLAHTLEQQGELLLRYDAVAHEQLPNGIALLSGQGPTAQTAADCPTFTPLTPATAGAGRAGRSAKGASTPPRCRRCRGSSKPSTCLWRAYVEGIGEGPGQPAPCSHPAPADAGRDRRGRPRTRPTATRSCTSKRSRRLPHARPATWASRS